MRRLGKLENGIPLPDGGYFGSLTVHHQLHCIVSHHLQMALQPEADDKILVARTSSAIPKVLLGGSL